MNKEDRDFIDTLAKLLIVILSIIGAIEVHGFWYGM